MKKTKNFLISVVMAMVMLFAGIFSFGLNQRTALAQTDTDQSGIIYYVADTQTPLLSSPTLLTAFGADYEILYYYYPNEDEDEADIYDCICNSAVNSSGYEKACMIIDIKRLSPDSQTLSNWFSVLKETNWITVFVSLKEASEFSNTNFLQYVDIFMPIFTYAGLSEFFFESLDDLETKHGTITDTCYLIGNRFVNVDYPEQPTLDTLCANSKFLRGLVDNLIARLDPDTEYQSYSAMVETLRENEIKLLVHVAGDTFIDVLTWETYVYSNLSALLVDSEFECEHACAFGVWQLETAFHEILNNIQDSDEDDEEDEDCYDLPVYLVEMETIIYDPNGLAVITATNLDVPIAKGLYLELLEILHEWLDEETE